MATIIMEEVLREYIAATNLGFWEREREREREREWSGGMPPGILLKLTIKMVQSGTYLDIFRTWNYNRFFLGCREHINFMIQGFSGQVFFPEEECSSGHVFNLEINLVQSGAPPKLLAKIFGCATCLFCWTNAIFPETGLIFPWNQRNPWEMGALNDR